MTKSHQHRYSFVHEHSLSIVSASILLLWIVLYTFSNPSTHIGSFFGNAIADWSGVVLMVIATKYLYEKGSSESKRAPKLALTPILQELRNHSLSIFLVITGIAWVLLYAAIDS